MRRAEVTELNKRATIVNTEARAKRLRHFNCQHETKVKIEITGRIFQICNNSRHTYFLSVKLRPSALIKIENNSPCKMRAIVHLGRGKIVKQTVLREQQVSIYVPSLKKLEIRCTGEANMVCRGYYSLCLV